MKKITNVVVLIKNTVNKEKVVHYMVNVLNSYNYGRVNLAEVIFRFHRKRDTILDELCPVLLLNNQRIITRLM